MEALAPEMYTDAQGNTVTVGVILVVITGLGAAEKAGGPTGGSCSGPAVEWGDNVQTSRGEKLFAICLG